MEESYAFSLLRVMDCLWFHQTLFFTESPSVLCQQHQHLENPPLDNSQTSLILQEEASSVPFDTPPQEDGGEARQKEIRLEIVHSHSYSSPSICKRLKSLGELELEEVKGFMDLGFIFDEEDTNKKMRSVVPGLQRLRPIKTGPDRDTDDEERSRMRPYLSEAWLIKAPNSPLLNLRMPRVSAAADMKNHLRHWAKTVATVVRQES